MPPSRYYLKLHYSLFSASTSFRGIINLNLVFIIMFFIFLFPCLYIPKQNIILYVFMLWFPNVIIFIKLSFLFMLHILILSSLPANFTILKFRGYQNLSFSSLLTFAYVTLFHFLLCNFKFWSSVEGIFIWGQPMSPFLRLSSYRKSMHLSLWGSPSHYLLRMSVSEICGMEFYRLCG